MTRTTPPRWRAVATAFAGMAVCIAFGRFSLGLLLPQMGASTGLGYAAAGGLVSLNLTGYLLGVIAIPYLARRVAHLQLVRAGLALATLGMATIAAPVGTPALLAAVTITGVAGSLGWVSGAAVGVEASNELNRGRVLGVVGTANGVGIVTAAALTVLLSHAAGVGTAWRIVWLVQSMIGLVAFVLTPTRSTSKVPRAVERRVMGLRGLLTMTIGYGLFGAGYAWFATYYVAAAATRAGMTGATAWLVLGVGACLGALVFGIAGDRWGHARALVTSQGAAFVASGLMAMSGDRRSLVMAAGFVFGTVLTAMSVLVPATLAAAVGPADAAAAFASLTLVFAVVQSLSPALGGLVVDHAPHGFITLFAAASVTFLAAGATFAVHASGRLGRS